MLKVLLSLSYPSLTMTSEVGTLGELTEKLKRLIDDIQNQYESFIDSNQLYKQRKVNEKAFFGSIGDYMVAMSAMNFLAIQVILEIKSAIEKKKSSNVERDHGSFVATTGKPIGTQQYTLPKPQPLQQQNPIESLNSETRPTSISKSEATHVGKNCIICGAVIAKKAKFCTKCGKSQ
jgi:hypothetical protein